MTLLARHLQYPIAASLAVLVFAVVGQGVVRAVGLGHGATKRHLLLLSPGIGMATTALVATVVSRFEIGVSATVTWIVVAGIVLVTRSISLVRNRLGRVVSVPVPSGDHWWRTAAWFPVVSSVGLVPYAQLFLRDLIPAGYLTSATWTNNDLGAYLLTSSNVVRAGIGDAGLVAGINIGDWARFDHPAAHVLFSVIAGIFGTEPHKVGIIYMTTAVATLLCASVVVVEKLADRQLSPGRWMVLTVAVLNVAIVGTIANFFVSQMVTLAYVTVIFGVAVVALEGEIDPRSSIVVGIVCLASFLTSPEITLPLVPLLLVVSLLHTGRWRTPRDLVPATAVFFGVVAVFALVRWELLSSQFEVVSRNAGFAEAGWKSNFFSIAMLGGLVPGQYGGPFGTTVSLLDTLLLVTLVLWITRRIVSRTSGGGIPFGVSALGLMLIIGAARWGHDAYRTWKMIVTCVPLFVVLLMALAWRGVRGSSRAEALSIATSLLVIGATFSWSAEVWQSAGPSNYVNSNLASLATTPEARRQTRLNISVAPYFETMAAASIVGNGVLMSSPSYFLPFGQPPKPGCTLTNIETLENLKDAGPVIARRGRYVLVGTPRCE